MGPAEASNDALPASAGSLVMSLKSLWPMTPELRQWSFPLKCLTDGFVGGTHFTSACFFLRLKVGLSP